MYIEATGRIFVELFDPNYEKLKRFLISCCEPQCRTTHVNEYAITPSSLAAAASEGVFTEEDIRNMLRKYGKRRGTTSTPPSAVTGSALPDRDTITLDVPAATDTLDIVGGGGADVIPPEVEQMLQASSSANRLRMLLQRRPAAETKSESGSPLAYYLASTNKGMLERVVAHSFAISDCLVASVVAGEKRYVFSDLEKCEMSVTDGSAALREDDGAATSKRQRVESSEHPTAGRSTFSSTRLVYKCEVQFGKLRAVRKEIQENLNLHIDCSYDFANDAFTQTVANFTLKPTTRLRPYQESSLERFQSAGRVRNGIVVLPCGAGKTLTGIAASAMIGKPVIVMCINVQSVLQWREQFLLWTQLKEDQVSICTKEEKQAPKDIFITTYTMLTAESRSRATLDASKRSQQSLDNEKWKKKIFTDIREKSWGLLVLDEVHTAPAENFQRVVDKVRAHCILGLTATLLREDSKIDDLRFLVGPKLFEANWLELAKAGHLATVHCSEIRCPLPIPFLRRYIVTSDRPSRTDIECMNPVKFWCTQALIKFHTETRVPSDKMIIFCDSSIAIRYYAHRLGVPFMDGKAGNEERSNLLDHFRKNPKVNVLLISRVGDTALDLPEANVIVQVHGLCASRRQEAQRLGRILRPKPPSMDSASAFFYTLVSQDTDEEAYMFPRQQWLREQGFAYRVLTSDEVLGFYRSGKPLVQQQQQDDAMAIQQQQQHHHQPHKHATACVGPPRWSLQVTAALVPTLQSLGWQVTLSDLKRHDALHHHRRMSHHHHHDTAFWIDFDGVASQDISRSFLKGKKSASCKAPNGSSCSVQFSAGDGAVGTHGVVQFPSSDGTSGSGEGETTAEQQPAVTLVRRMSQDGVSHECDAGCLDFALSWMGHRADKGGPPPLHHGGADGEIAQPSKRRRHVKRSVPTS